MDIVKGAQLLADLVKKHGVDETREPPTEIDENAPPVFHWVGVAPPGNRADA
jgi:hypothetical protein